MVYFPVKHSCLYNKHISCLFLPAHTHLERKKDIHMSCLFLPVHSSCDRYSLSSRNYEPHAFYRKHFWWFFTLITKNIHIYFLCLPAHPHSTALQSCLLLTSIDISYRARITNRSRFIESISGVVPHLERRIYTYLVCFCQRTLATIDIPFLAGIINRTRFIESRHFCWFFTFRTKNIHIYFLFLPAHSHSTALQSCLLLT